jgi:hypothetical protein
MYPQQPIPSSQPQQDQQNADTSSPKLSQKTRLLIVGVCLLGLFSGVGASFITARMSKTEDDTPLKVLEEKSFTLAKADVPKEPAATGVLADYKDDLIGLSFRYPKDWGEVIRHKAGDSDRSFYTSPGTDSTMDYTFSKVPLTFMPIINNKNSYLVNQSACFLPLGFINAAIDQTKVDKPYSTDWEQTEVGESNHFTTYSKSYEISKDRIVIISYEISTIVSTQGYCNGLSVYGQQKLSINSKKVQLLQFIWSDTASTFGINQKALDLPDLEAFKIDPKKYFNDKNMDALRAVLSSVKTY